MKKFSWTNIFLFLIAVTIGGLIGGYVFRDVQPRAILAIDQCDEHCLRPNDLVGLLTSAGIQNVPGLLPKALIETDKTIAIKHPFPQAPIHYLIFPKRDIRNIGELSDYDEAYLLDAFSVISTLIRRDHLENYKLVSNGPENQISSYLHFHLMAEKPENTVHDFNDNLNLTNVVENGDKLKKCEDGELKQLRENFAEAGFENIHPMQISDCFWLSDMRFAFVTEPNMNFDMQEVRKWEKNGNVASSGLLYKFVKGNWQWLFHISKARFNPVGLYLEDDRLVLDIADDSGAGSGEGRLLRYSYAFKLPWELYEWQEENCEWYYIPEKYSYGNMECSR